MIAGLLYALIWLFLSAFSPGGMGMMGMMGMPYDGDLYDGAMMMESPAMESPAAEAQSPGRRRHPPLRPAGPGRRHRPLQRQSIHRRPLVRVHH